MYVRSRPDPRPWPHRRGKPSHDEVVAMLVRSQFQPLAPWDGHLDTRWQLRCLLCGQETSTRVSNLAERDRARTRHNRNAKRTICQHRGPRPPQPPGPLTQAEARAVLRTLQGDTAATATVAYASALDKIRRGARRAD